MSTKDEKYYYKFIREWLEKKGVKAVISEEVGITIPTGPYFPRITIQPDILGLREGDWSKEIVAVEVKTNQDRIYEAVGQSVIYQIMADYVYLAIPEKISESIRNTAIFNMLRIGLLEFSTKMVGMDMPAVTVKERMEPRESRIIDYGHFYPQLKKMLEDCFK